MRLLFCFLFAGFFFTAPFVGCSRRLPESRQPTTVLDVAEALEKTKNALSFDPAKKPAFSPLDQSLSASSSSSSLLSLQIHPRVSIDKSSHLDYKSLTLCRLGRDSSRVSLLTTRLALVVNSISRSDLKPLDNGLELRAEDLESPIVSGSSQGSGEYFSRVGIGKPPNQVYMVLDTGSDVNWVQCAPCADCYQQADPIFEPASSSSYSPLPCETQQCKYLDISECRNDTCLYQVSYGDGSYTVGDFVTETITLGSDSVDNVAIGCGHNNECLFIGTAGLLGLGGGPLSFSSQLNANSFSYCLVDRDSDSTSTLNFESALPPNAITAPLLRNHQLDTDTYDVLRDAYVKMAKNLPPIDSLSLFDTCYDLSNRTSVDVPTVSFHFPDAKVLSLPAKNYLIPVDSTDTFCFAFAPTSSSLAIIWNVQ
ncbi:hypothetical protein CRYUN_Cryun21dG0002800 [Craigia yunnanensis]